MHATVRRYQGVDPARKDELTKKVDETLIPSLSKLPGFAGYFLVESEKDVMTSFSLFGTSAEANESTRVAANWIREQKLETAIPNPPQIVGGEVVAYKTNGAVRA